MSDWLIFLIVLAVVGLIVRREWRGHQRKWVMPAWTGPDSPQTPVPVDEPDGGDDDRATDRPRDDETGPDAYVAGGVRSVVLGAMDDEAWAAELHAINQLGKFGDLTRPIAHQTHYEVEAVIRQLGVPEWIPGRVRVAA